MTEVCFYPAGEIADHKLVFAVIVCRYGGKWVYARHRERSSWEIPGGHREPGEDIEAAARRELYEETGAQKYTLRPVCAYGVRRGGAESHGMLYYARVAAFGPLPEAEMAEIGFFEQPPDNLTYPDIQPQLMQKTMESYG